MNRTASTKKNIHGLVGLGILVVSEVLLFLKIEPAVSWFYSIAWWSYILIADSLVYSINKNSLILNRPRQFLQLLPWSVTIWLVFEQFNFALQNWHYIALPQNVWLRWAGYVVAYATVLPGLFETTELLEALGLFKRSSVRPLADPRALYIPFAVSGSAMVALSMLLPRYCFPLVWMGFIFLLEPANHKLGGKSLLSDWANGTLRTFYLLLLAGLICGLLWEFWNFWAKSKWLYSIPFFNEWPIFEMPLLGFLGFPPFAVECYVMYNFAILCMRRGLGEQKAVHPSQPTRRTWQHLLVYLFMMIFWGLSFYLIDQNTVISFRS
jgi:hypothetical protein